MRIFAAAMAVVACVMSTLLPLPLGEGRGEGAVRTVAYRSPSPLTPLPEGEGNKAGDARPTFRTVEVWVDSGAVALAAWQIEINNPSGAVKMVGVEGGEHAAFRDAPFYDPAALQQSRMIIAAFSLNSAEALPSGRTRVATVHVMAAGDAKPELKAELGAAATVDGREVKAKVELKIGADS